MDSRGRSSSGLPGRPIGLGIGEPGLSPVHKLPDLLHGGLDLLHAMVGGSRPRGRMGPLDSRAVGHGLPVSQQAFDGYKFQALLT